MGMLLAYELEKGTERELKDLAVALGHQVKMVSSSNYGDPLGYVAAGCSRSQYHWSSGYH